MSRPTASITFTVIVCISVSALRGLECRVTAVSCEPVLVVVIRPSGSRCVGVGVLCIVPATNVANTVIAKACVSSLAHNVAGVIGTNEPVIGCVCEISGGCSVGVTCIYPCTNIAFAVKVLINVSRLVSLRNCVTAGYCMPVIGGICRPLACVIGVGMIVVIRTGVTDAVIVGVNVCALLCSINRVTAGYCVPVIVFINCPLVVKGMYMVGTMRAYVTSAVIVGVCMQTNARALFCMLTSSSVPVHEIIALPLGYVILVLMCGCEASGKAGNEHHTEK